MANKKCKTLYFSKNLFPTMTWLAHEKKNDQNKLVFLNKDKTKKAVKLLKLSVYLMFIRSSLSHTFQLQRKHPQYAFSTRDKCLPHIFKVDGNPTCLLTKIPLRSIFEEPGSKSLKPDDRKISIENALHTGITTSQSLSVSP